MDDRTEVALSWTVEEEEEGFAARLRLRPTSRSATPLEAQVRWTLGEAPPVLIPSSSTFSRFRGEVLHGSIKIRDIAQRRALRQRIDVVERRNLRAAVVGRARTAWHRLNGRDG